MTLDSIYKISTGLMQEDDDELIITLSKFRVGIRFHNYELGMAGSLYIIDKEILADEELVTSKIIEAYNDYATKINHYRKLVR